MNRKRPFDWTRSQSYYMLRAAIRRTADPGENVAARLRRMGPRDWAALASACELPEPDGSMREKLIASFFKGDQ